jgi:hypothetical protein
VTLTFGTVPASTGPGMRLFVHGVTGPVAVDDFLQVDLTRASDGGGYSYGTILGPIAGTNIVTFGWDGRLRKVVSGNVEGMVEGEPMQVYAAQYHAAGGLVDDSAVTAWGVLDTHSYPWCLMQYSAAADLAAVLAAVHRDF